MDYSSVSIHHQWEMTLSIILGINISLKHLEKRVIKLLYHSIAFGVIDSSTCFTYSKSFKGSTRILLSKFLPWSECRLFGTPNSENSFTKMDVMWIEVRSGSTIAVVHLVISIVLQVSIGCYGTALQECPS